MKFFLLSIITMCMAQLASSQTKTSCTDDACCKKSTQTAFVCKLTSPELRQRKATTNASLKEKIVEKKELKNGGLTKAMRQKSETREVLKVNRKG